MLREAQKISRPLPLISGEVPRFPGRSLWHVSPARSDGGTWGRVTPSRSTPQPALMGGYPRWGTPLAGPGWGTPSAGQLWQGFLEVRYPPGGGTPSQVWQEVPEVGYPQEGYPRPGLMGEVTQGGVPPGWIWLAYPSPARSDERCLRCGTPQPALRGVP